MITFARENNLSNGGIVLMGEVIKNTNLHSQRAQIYNPASNLMV